MSFLVPHRLEDCGRGSSHPEEKKDCTVRATAACLGLTYNEAHARLKALGRKDRHGFCIGRVIEALGLEQRPDLSCMTLWRALERMQHGRYLVRVAAHAFAVVDGVVIDTWPQKPGRRIRMVYAPHRLPNLIDALAAYQVC